MRLDSRLMTVLDLAFPPERSRAVMRYFMGVFRHDFDESLRQVLEVEDET